MGLAIHAAALLGYKADSEPLWTDWLFLTIDAVVVTGLLARTMWGYWLAVLLFVQQVVCQGTGPCRR